MPEELPDDQLSAKRLMERGFPRVQVAGGYKLSTVRFVTGSPCCTSVYNFRMTDLEQATLARRIVAALNATAHLNLRELEELSPSDV